MDRIKIDRAKKIMLLNALKNGYFEMPDMENLFSGFLPDELSSIVKELAQKLGVSDLLTIEIIDRREQVEKLSKEF